MPHPPPVLVSIQVSLPRSYGHEDATDPMDKPWTTGFFKSPVMGEVFVGKTNLVGDGQADLRYHGGPDKAVLAYSADHYPFWNDALSKAITQAAGFTPEDDPAGISSAARWRIPGGAFGENLTIAGLTEAEVCIGDTWRIGDVVFQISQPRQPCWKLARRWRIKDLAARVFENGKSGWYFRVLEEGLIEAGQPAALLARPHANWSVARSNHVMHHDERNLFAAAELAALPELASSWQDELTERVAKGT